MSTSKKERFMRNTKLSLVIAAALAVTLAVVTPAMAVDHYWGLTGVDGNWADTNWVDTNGVPLGTIPDDGNNIRFKTATGSNSSINIQGADTFLPNSTMIPQDNNTVSIWIYDGNTLTPTAAPAPPANNTDFTILGGYASIEDASAAAQTLTLGTINFYKKGTVRFYMPLVATLHKGPENGDSFYYGPVTFTTDDIPRNNGWTSNMRFYNDYTATTKKTGTQTSSLNEFFAVTNIGDLNHVNGVIRFMPTSSGTVTNLNQSGGSIDVQSGAITFTNSAGWTGGAVILSDPNAGLGAPGAIPTGAELRIGTAQNTFPTVTVQAGGLLSGDVTGAVYGGGGKNVTFVEDAILAATAGPDPNRTDLGGAIIGYGVPNTGSGGPYLAGDDGSTTIYKFLALGGWAPSNDINVELGAVAGSGNLKVQILSEQDNKAGAIWRGDGASTTADITFPGLKVGRLDLDNGLNETAIGVSETNLVTTFNLSRDYERQEILRFEGGGTIDATQTINIDGGKAVNTNSLTGGNLQGTLSITNGEFDQPTDDFTGADIGTLHFGNRGVLSINKTDNFDAYEGLAAGLTYSDNPVAQWQGDSDGTIQDPDLTTNTVLAGFLANSDWVASSYKAVTLGSDVALGHGRYIFNTYWRGNGNGWRDSSYAGGAGGEVIEYAHNGPIDGSAWIGIAATKSNQPMRIDIYAPDATLRLGCEDPTRLFSADNDSIGDADFYDTPADNTVYLYHNVTAKGIDVKSGGLQIEGTETTQFISASPTTPFPVNFAPVSGNKALNIRSEAIDASNPVDIVVSSGNALKFWGAVDVTNPVFDLSDTSFTVSGLNSRMEVNFGGGGADLHLLVNNLNINTECYIDDGATLQVVGTLSGTGRFTYRNWARVLSTGTVAPGDNGVGALNKGGVRVYMDDGASYDWEITDPDDVDGAGSGWDILWGSDIDFDTDNDEAGDFTLNIIDAGLTRDVVATEKFAIMAVTGGFDIPTTWNVTVNAPDWTGTATLEYRTDTDIDGDAVNDKAYFLSGLARSLAQIGDADGNGVVDAADYIALKTNMGMGSGAALADGDFDGDGDVDWTDLQILQDHYGEGAAGSGVIPEPATLGLLAVGAMALIRRRRRA